jgi:UDP-N-acetylmuramate--alanine ligase
VIDLKNIQTFYFVGIGGIGMSALARYCKSLGKTVYGYDKTPTELTETLIAEGLPITFLDVISEIPETVVNNKNTLVVYTPAIPKANVILNYFISEGFSVVKRAALLGSITKHSRCLAVAGTHGKTTTSAILGHLLATCDMPVTAFLGGIAENYNSNFISNGTEITVVEADEFDRSFLQLSPDIACITSMDADHLDIYGDVDEIGSAFREFAHLVKNSNSLLIKKGLPLEGSTVAIASEADYQAKNIRIEDGGYCFDLKTPSLTINDLTFYLPGHHNLFNAVTAMGMALLVGAPVEQLPKALASFKGVKRRFSYKIKQDDLVLIDDYAHHPSEIDALYQAVSEMYPEDQKLIVFQPHLFSRTRDFADDFAKSLAKFDEILLLDIYPARELPLDGVTSQWLLEKIPSENVQLLTKEELVSHMSKSGCRIQLMVGAGDIGAEVSEVTKKLSHAS